MPRDGGIAASSDEMEAAVRGYRWQKGDEEMRRARARLRRRLRNGLFILSYDGPHEDEVDETSFLEGNSDIGA